MSDPIEDLTHDFIEEHINEAKDGVLFKLELHDTLFKKIETANGIRIGDAQSDLSVNHEDEIQEYDGQLMLVIYSQILDKNKTERRAARKLCVDIAKAVAKLFIDDEKMRNRVCRSRTLTAIRGYDSINSKPYAVINLPLIINETGQYNFGQSRR